MSNKFVNKLRLGIFKFFLFSLVIVNVYANNLAQKDILSKQVSINMQGASLTNVLDEIEQQTQVSFTYSTQKISADKKISIQSKDKSLEQVLEDIAMFFKIQYKVFSDNIIVLTNASDKWPAIFNISGTVSDQSGLPMVGVSISIKGADQNTVSDKKGEYSIEVKGGQILIFFYKDYIKQEVIVEKEKVMDIALQVHPLNRKIAIKDLKLLIEPDVLQSFTSDQMASLKTLKRRYKSSFQNFSRKDSVYKKVITTKKGKGTSYKSLFNRTNDISGYGGVIFETLKPKNNVEILMVGGGGGLIFSSESSKKIKTQFFLGGFGIRGNYNSTDTKNNIKYGGLWSGLALGSDWVIHPVIGIKAGWGSFETEFQDNNTLSKDDFFTWIPNIRLEINVSGWLRINGGVGYRFVNGLSNNDISEGLNINAGIYMGWFR